jgi:hypothetical protein
LATRDHAADRVQRKGVIVVPAAPYSAHWPVPGLPTG